MKIFKTLGLTLIFFIGVCAFSNINILTGNTAQNKRHFLIGYIGDYNGLVGSGGYDTISIEYPNYYELINFFEKKYSLKRVKILSICEMNQTDYTRFWSDLYKKR